MCRVPDRDHERAHVELPICLQENILAESSAMIPDTRQRLEQACEQLQAALVGAWPGG